MLYGAIVGAIAGSLVWLVFYIASSASKAAGRAFPANTMTCLTMLPPAEALQAVRQGLQAPYAVDETGTAPDAIVLASPPNFKNYGFFVFVRARPHPEGSTLVEVACTSRNPLPAAVPARIQQEALQMVRTAVGGA